MTYLEKRLSEIGEVDALVNFKCNDFNTGKLVTRTLFSSDDNDNLIIHYHGLHGSPWPYKPTERTSKYYDRVRVKKPKNGAKYLSPKGVGLLPFFPPNTIEKYRVKEKINTLFVIEGELKSLAASINGIDAIGLGSIHGFYAPADNNRPYFKEFAPEIIQLIKECKVESIVYVTDADTLSLSYDYDKDLSKRAISFCSAAINFRSIVKRIIYDGNTDLVNFFYSHINKEFNPRSKGVDDLFNNQPKEKKEIVNDLLSLCLSKKYFTTFDLKVTQDSHLRSYFGVDSETNFYEVYKDCIGNREFIYRRIKYYFDGEYLKTLKDYRLDDYVRVGFNYYKIFLKTRFVEGLMVKTNVIVPWSKSEIVTDLGKNACSKIRKYNDFINVPNWLNYSSVIDNCYNICLPLPYTPRKGLFDNTIKFLQHIANDDEFIKIVDGKVIESPILGCNGTMILDYLSIMFQNPTHLLPIPCLLSKEQSTGKTTLAQLIYNMFQGNSIILQTNDFLSNFNSHWVGKMFICVDEGHFEDKRRAKEQIKQVTTSDTVTLNTKGVAQKEVQSYSKLMICSNDEDSFIKLEKTDTRFWLMKIKSIENKDPGFKAKIFKEISMFADFLIKREIFHPRESRLWFADKYIQNEMFQKFVETSKAHWQIEIDQAISYIFENTEETEVFLAPLDILDIVKQMNTKSNMKKLNITNYLKRDLGMKNDNRGNVQSYKSWKVNAYESYSVEHEMKKGRPYLFKKEDFHKLD